MRKHLPKHTHKISACHDLTITHNIPAAELAALEQTYKYMLESIRDAKQQKTKQDKEHAEIIRLGPARKITYERTCIKIAHLEKCGKTSKEIDKIMLNKNGYCLNRVLASHGRALKREKILQAKKRLVLKLVNAGHGIRPTARQIPPALGKCSPSLVCKIVKADQMRKQSPLPFPLTAI